MSKYAYSPSNNIFYPKFLEGEYKMANSWPGDTIDVDDNVADKYLSAPPEGKKRGAGDDGLPRWIDLG